MTDDKAQQFQLSTLSQMSDADLEQAAKELVDRMVELRKSQGEASK